MSDLTVKLTWQPNTLVSHLHVTTVTLTSSDDVCALHTELAAGAFLSYVIKLYLTKNQNVCLKNVDFAAHFVRNNFNGGEKKMFWSPFCGTLTNLHRSISVEAEFKMRL